MATIQDVFNYVMHTPGNTNPAVLLSLLNNLETNEQTGMSDLPLNPEGKD